MHQHNQAHVVRAVRRGQIAEYGSSDEPEPLEEWEPLMRCLVWPAAIIGLTHFWIRFFQWVLG